MLNPFRSLFERRSVGSSHELYELLTRGARSVAGTDVTEASALRIAAVLTCVSLVSRTIASLPLKVYERSADGRSKQPATHHPLARILSQPNSWQTRSELIQTLQAHLMLRGNAFAWINRGVVGDRKQVSELIPLHPDRVQTEQVNDFGELQYVVRLASGGALTLPASQMLHLRGFSTNGLTGRSVLQDARDVIGIAQATQTHAGSYWAGGGVPDVALRHPKTLGDKARKTLEEGYAETYGSGTDRRRWIILEEGMDLTPISITAEDAQFLETRKFQRGEICGLFHVPPHLIGDTEKSTSWGTGIEQQTIGFVNFGLRPWLVAWEQRINRDLITAPHKYFVEFNIDGFLRGDSAARGQFYTQMRQMGAMSANDVRGLENLNPVAGGDDYRPLVLGKDSTPPASDRVADDEDEGEDTDA